MKNYINRNSSQISGYNNYHKNDTLKDDACKFVSNFASELPECNHKEFYSLLLAVNLLLSKDARSKPYDTPLNHLSLVDRLQQLDPKMNDEHAEDLAQHIEILATHDHESDSLAKLPRRLGYVIDRLDVEHKYYPTENECSVLIITRRLFSDHINSKIGNSDSNRQQTLGKIRQQIEFLREDRQHSLFSTTKSENDTLRKDNENKNNTIMKLEKEIGQLNSIIEAKDKKIKGLQFDLFNTAELVERLDAVFEKFVPNYTSIKNLNLKEVKVHVERFIKILNNDKINSENYNKLKASNDKYIKLIKNVATLLGIDYTINKNELFNLIIEKVSDLKNQAQHAEKLQSREEKL